MSNEVPEEPLDKVETRRMLANVWAAELEEYIEAGHTLTDAAADPELQGKIDVIYEQSPITEEDRERLLGMPLVQDLFDMCDKQVQELVDQGVSDEDARNIVHGRLIGALLNHMKKDNELRGE